MLCMFNLKPEPGYLASEASQYSEELRAIVRACLKCAPESRYTSDMLATLIEGGRKSTKVARRGRLFFEEWGVEWL
jgi:hypothetical protein